MNIYFFCFGAPALTCTEQQVATCTTATPTAGTFLQVQTDEAGSDVRCGDVLSNNVGDTEPGVIICRETLASRMNVP